MEWGLNGIQLSHLHNASIPRVSQQGLGMAILEAIGYSLSELATSAFSQLEDRPLYDFYLSRDINDEGLVIRDFQGYDFFDEITTYLKNKYPNTEGDAKLEYITLDELPKSAIAYCYNKNKRNEKGEVVTLNWYLPAIDEIEDIVEVEYLSFNGVFQNNMYWSCQPAFEMRYLNMPIDTWAGDGLMNADFYVDDLDRARGTKVIYKGLDENGNPINTPASSSIPGYSGTQNATATKGFLQSAKVTLGDYVSNGELTYLPDHEGNKPRSGSGKESWARVRCVYKP